MIIDPIDLNLLRLLELQGVIPVQEFISKFHISKKEILARIRNFEESGLISSYGFKLFLPGIHGGKWYWGCIAGEAAAKFKVGRSIPYVQELMENLSFPPGVCPNVSLLFYTRNLRDVRSISTRLPGMKYCEVYKISEYSVGLPRLVLADDWKFLDELCHARDVNYALVSSIADDPGSEKQVRIARLIWTRKNREGIISIVPNFNWSVIKNYLHIHIAAVTKMRVKELQRVLKEIGYVGNITSRFKKRYMQIEFDLWGFSDLRVVVNALMRIDRLTVEGCSFAYRNTIYDEWVKDYIQSQV